MTNKPELNTYFCGFLCENPFLLAASPVSRQGDMIERAFSLGWGGAITKSISLDQDLPDSSLSPRFAKVTASGCSLLPQNNSFGMANIDFRIDKSLKNTVNEFAIVKRKYPQKFLAISIKAQYSKEDWQKITEIALEARPDALELCLSCPDENGNGCCVGSIGQNPESIKQVISWVKQITPLPLITKLNAHVNNIVVIGEAAQKAGAAGIAAINTVKGFAGLNLATNSPLPTVEGMSTVTGLSGSLIKPLAMHLIYELCKNKDSINIPVSGVGGITCAQDAIEYLLIGASTVQVATQVMHKGYGIIEDMIWGVSRFMDYHGYRRLSDFVGSAIPKYMSSTKGLSRKQQLKSNIESEICIGCGRCYVACRDGAYQAINFSEERLAEVDNEKCVGCGLCKIVCPVAEAIYFTYDGKRMEGLV